MPLLTDEQLHAIRQIVQDHHNAFVANYISPEVLSPETLDRLRELGLISTAANTVEDAYVYGMVLAATQDPKVQNMNLDQFREYLSKNPMPLSDVERRAMQYAQHQAGQYAVGLGATYSNLAGQKIISQASELEQEKMRGQIRTLTAEAIARRKATGRLRSDLGWATKDWTRDWNRISITELNNAHQQGIADDYAGRYGPDVRVAKRPTPDACEHCKRLHLVGSAGPPRVFKLSELTANGTNFKKKAAEWKAVVGSVHPHCQCQMVRVPAGWGFDENWDLVPLSEGGDREDYETAGEVRRALEQEDELRKAFKLQGHIDYQGIPIAIENKAGTTRTWKTPEGDQGQVRLEFAYGYAKRTSGDDEDEIDVYIGPDPRSQRVFVVNQLDPATGRHDETKSFLGFRNEQDSKLAYLEHVNNPAMFGGMLAMDIDQFKRWLGTTKPLPGHDLGETKLTIPLQKAQLTPDALQKAGPFIGPRGGKWKDPQHTIPWKPEDPQKYDVPSIKNLMGQGYSQKQAEMIQRNIAEKEDTNSWSLERVAKEAHKHPKLSSKIGSKKVEVFRVVPKGITSINTGDYVFSNRADAEQFRNEYGYVRGQPNIIAMSASSEDFILPHVDDDELIFTGKNLQKAEARGGKYIRREPYTDPKTGKRRYRYFYRESAAAREARAGAEIRLGKRVVKVIEVKASGQIILSIEGKRTLVEPKQWHNILTRHYGRAFLDSAQRRAQQAINAVLRHVPREQLEDLKGETDEQRLAELQQKVPEVYAKLRKAFKRSGMSPFQAKRSLEMILERRGWRPEARALVIGTVIKHREVGTRELISASENLAGGRPVHERHVAAVVELRAPGGKPEAFPQRVQQVARAAESELAVLSKALAQAKRDRDDAQKAAEALSTALGSEAMQKLQLISQAFPGLQDKAIPQVKRALEAVNEVSPKRPPTDTGGETVVYVSGEGGRPEPVAARYKLVEADTLIASHDPNTFARRPDYPEDVQERAYHRDKAEQTKVIRNAQKMDARFVVNTNPDAVNGPPMVMDDGVVLGGNSRTMSMQRIYSQHPDKAEELRQYLKDHAHEAGLTAEDVEQFKNPVLIREVDVEDRSKRSLQLLVRQMNETFTQAMDPRTMQVAMGRRLTDETLAAIGNDMEDDDTLASFLSNKRSEPFVAALFRAGIIDNRNVNQYMRRGTRQLNEDGRQLVARILVGRTVDDADILSNTGTQMMDSIARSVPFIAQAKAIGGDEYDISQDLGVAIDAFNDLQRRVEQGTLRSLDPKMKPRELEQLYNYFQVLPGIAEPHPVLENKRAQVLLETLIRKRGPVQMSKVFREFAKTARANPAGQATMFGAATTGLEALRQALAGGEPEQPELLAASMPLAMTLQKAGPFVGPRGGLWADPQHKIPWRQKEKKEPPKRKLPLATATEQGKTFKTGEPVTFRFLRGTQSAGKPPPNDPYQQKIEPAGRYMVHNEDPGELAPGWITGEITFTKPLVLELNTGEGDRVYDENSWKAHLQKATGKKGKALSKFLAGLGFDGIVTVSGSGTREIVDLRFLHSGVIEKGGPQRTPVLQKAGPKRIPILQKARELQVSGAVASEVGAQTSRAAFRAPGHGTMFNFVDGSRHIPRPTKGTIGYSPNEQTPEDLERRKVRKDLEAEVGYQQEVPVEPRTVEKPDMRLFIGLEGPMSHPGRDGVPIVTSETSQQWHPRDQQGSDELSREHTSIGFYDGSTDADGRVRQNLPIDAEHGENLHVRTDADRKREEAERKRLEENERKGRMRPRNKVS